MIKFKHRRCPARAFTMMHPPPNSLGKVKSKVAAGEGTDYKSSTHHILIPTRYVGVSFCLKGGS